MIPGTRRAIFVATAILPLFSAQSPAATASWASSTSGRWLDAANWSPASLPTTSTPVSIATPGTYTVTVDNSAAASTITLDNPNATLLLNNSAAPTLALSTAGSVLLSAGTLVLNQETSATATPLTINGSSSTLTNNARINLTGSGSGLSFNNYLLSITTHSTTNTGTIEAYDPASGPDATFNIYGSTTNTGTIRTGPHSTILFTGSTFNQNAGTLAGNISFVSTGSFNYNGGSVSLASLGNGAILRVSPSAHAGTFSLFTGFFAGRIYGDLPSGNTVYVPASTSWSAAAGVTNVVNDGHLIVGRYPNSDSGSASFSLPSSDATLTNNGTLDLNSHNGTYSRISGRVVNNGTFNVAKAVGVTASNPATFPNNITNNGTFTFEPGAYLTNEFGRTFTQNAGTLTTNNALLLKSTEFYFNGGTIALGSSVKLTNTQLHFGPANPTSPAQGAIDFSIESSSSLPPVIDGDIPAGVTVNVSVAYPGYSVTFKSATNAGTFATFNDSLSSSGRLSNFYFGPGNGAPLINAGTITGLYQFSSGSSATGLYASATGGNITNTGAFVTLNFSFGFNTSPYTTFSQNAGTLTNNNTFSFRGGTFNYNGGSITGQPITLTAATLNLAPGVGPASFTFAPGGTIPGTTSNTLHGNVSPGSAITLSAGTTTNRNIVTADPLTNSGIITLSPYSTLRITGALSNPGTINVQANALVLLDYTTTSPTDAVRQQLLTAHLTSSAAPANSSLGYLDTGTQVQIWLVPVGDANLNGKVDLDDYTLLDRAFAQSLPSALWADGDFNYDGQITSADYLLIDTTLGSQAPLSPEFLSQRESQFGGEYISQLLTSIPEPSSAACLFAVLPVLRRARRST